MASSGPVVFRLLSPYDGGSHVARGVTCNAKSDQDWRVLQGNGETLLGHDPTG